MREVTGRKATSTRAVTASRTPAGEVEDSRSVVNSLAKGLRILEAFTAERPELTLSEAASLAGLDPGTVFRMLNTLVMLGYLSRLPESKRFRLTLKVVGTNTIGAMQSGIFWGYVGLIEGIGKRIADELGTAPTFIGTGGLISIVAEHTPLIQHVDPDLTLKGLVDIHALNRN